MNCCVFRPSLRSTSPAPSQKYPSTSSVTLLLSMMGMFSFMPTGVTALCPYPVSALETSSGHSLKLNFRLDTPLSLFMACTKVRINSALNFLQYCTTTR
eukprot:scaffold153_cov347-Pavlova_lutheri.AAC.28